MKANWIVLGMALATVTAAGAASPTRSETPAAARIVVEATNHNTLDVDVFVLVGQQRIRLGSVVTGQTQTFELPPQAVNAGQIRLAADPVGARNTYASDPVSVADGQKVRFVIAPQLPQSQVTIEAGPS